MADRETMPRLQDLGDPAAVAHLPVGLVAQQATRLGPGDFGGLLQVELGFGTAEFLVDDRPEAVPLTAPAGEAAFGRVPSAAR